jgi:hypothetical protein
MTKGQYVRRRMTETLDVRHLRALFQSFAIFSHEIERSLDFPPSLRYGAASARNDKELTTKETKDTKNLVGTPRCGAPSRGDARRHNIIAA